MSEPGAGQLPPPSVRLEQRHEEAAWATPGGVDTEPIAQQKAHRRSLVSSTIRFFQSLFSKLTAFRELQLLKQNKWWPYSPQAYDLEMRRFL